MSSSNLQVKSSDSIDVVALITQARSGKSASLGILLELYRNYLSLLATTQIDRRLRPRVSPSDIVQETMLKAHRAFASFRGLSEPELIVWLRTILVNNMATIVEQHLIAAKRDVRREVSLEKLGAALEHSTIQLRGLLPANVETPSVSAQKREEEVILADQMAKLPEDYREVLVLRNLKGIAFREIASTMKRSEAASRMLWLRAIEKLRDVYQEERSDVC